MHQHTTEGAGWSADGAVCLLLLGWHHTGGQADLPVVLLSFLHLLVQQQLEHPLLPHLLLGTCGHHKGETDAHPEIQVAFPLNISNFKKK